MTHRSVGEVMTTTVICAREDTPFKQVAGLLAGRHVSALPVVDTGGRVVGIVSESDLLAKEELQQDPGAPALHWWHRRALRDKAAGLKAREVMTSPAVTIGPEASVVEAARLIDAHHIKRLPVVTKDGRLVGIASRPDLLRVFLRSDGQIAGEITAEVFGAALGTNQALARAEVSEGVVTLTGEVEKASMIPMAVRLAGSVDGVIEVVNRLTFAVDDTVLPASADLTEYRHTGQVPVQPSLKQVE